MTCQHWHPLTNAQQAYWNEFMQYPDLPLSTVAHCLEINGKVDLDKLTLAIKHTLSEAEVLRLTFRRADKQGHPLQRVCLDDELDVDVFDLRDMDNALEHANASMFADANSPLDLEAKLITKVQIYVIHSQQVLWYLRTHHIAVDGYSMNLIEQRCAAIYRCFLKDEKPSRPLNAFSVYTQENSDYEQSTRFGIDKAYWDSYLSAANLDISNRDIPVTRTVCVERNVPESITDGLLALSKQLIIGWSDVLTLLCAAYLSQNWRTEERTSGILPVWIPFMNRMGNPCANTPSLMVNTFPYLASFDHEEPIESYLKRAVQELRSHYRHSRYRVENKLASGNHYFLSPFINILPFEPPQFTTCVVKHHVLAAGTADGFNVTFRCSPHAAEMRLILEAESPLFEEHELKYHSTGLMDYLSKALQDPQSQKPHINQQIINTNNKNS